VPLKSGKSQASPRENIREVTEASHPLSCVFSDRRAGSFTVPSCVVDLPGGLDRRRSCAELLDAPATSCSHPGPVVTLLAVTGLQGGMKRNSDTISGCSGSDAGKQEIERLFGHRELGHHVGMSEHPPIPSEERV
jgi:hypothetical protein